MPRTRKSPENAPPDNSTRGPRRGSADLAARARAIGGDCYARAARNLARRITQIYDRRLAPHDFTLPQFSMLVMIAGAKDDTLGALAAEAGLDPSTLTRNLQGLEKLGLVEIASVEEDQRRRAVWLTEAGSRRLSTALPAWQAAQQEVAAALGPRLAAELARASATL